MSVLIMVSLTLLITITFFNIILGVSFVPYNTNTPYGINFGINEITGAIAIIIIIIYLAVLLGIQIFGSGISEHSVRVVITLTSYLAIWGVFSVLSYNLIISIEIFGTLIYIFLTIMFVIGVINKISS